jgi:hypothetical protein
MALFAAILTAGSKKGQEPSMDANLTLREPTVQDFQLELLRRTQFNALDGEGIKRAS